MRQLNRILALAFVTASPAIARAQFTTFIPPRNVVAESIKTVVAVQKQATQDSIVHTQLTSMRTWVDSAAGLKAIAPTPADSLMSAAPGTTVAGNSATSAPATTFRNGARAPSTASSLPLVALVGFALFGVGMILTRRRDGELELATASNEDPTSAKRERSRD